VDPLAETPWSRPETIKGFVESPPNEALMRFATSELGRARHGCALDLGCGAGRNALPMARLGWSVLGVDLSEAMLRAAAGRLGVEPDVRVHLALAPMDRLPVRDASCDLIVAHGIWNLARSAAEFRRAVREAARVARPGAGLFVFTFSRNTLSADARPVRGEPFVFTRFSGQPQCFLTGPELVSELAAAGFEPDPRIPLRELNRPQPGALPTQGPPVIYEGAFRLITTPES
jgi:SAM-dependent methyltransferase